MGSWATIIVLALVLLQGCGGSGGDAKKAGRPASPDAAARVKRLTDDAIGYSLLVPPGWTFPASRSPGQPVPFGGGGEGCAVGQAGVLGDVGGRKLLAFARRTARRRAANATAVSVDAVRGQNATGALVEIAGPGRKARSALFASAGSGMAITCTAAPATADAQARGLSLLLSSVSLRRERPLERAQAAVVGLPGVRAAAVRRDGSRAAVQVRLSSFAGAANRVRDVVAAVARELPRTDIAVNATTATQPQRVALGRYLGGTMAGSVQVAGRQPRRFTLR